MDLADDAKRRRRPSPEPAVRQSELERRRASDTASPPTARRRIPRRPRVTRPSNPNPQSSIPNLKSGPYLPKTLKHLLRTRGRLPFAECLDIALALATALEHLHGHGLVHRDIKPSNVIFVGGVPKLADIGLVTSIDATQSFVGTEGFFPPEGPGTAQADIFSLGKLLYEIATGQRPPRVPGVTRRPGNARGTGRVVRAQRHYPQGLPA